MVCGAVSSVCISDPKSYHSAATGTDVNGVSEQASNRWSACVPQGVEECDHSRQLIPHVFGFQETATVKK